jgi:undecaprenyl-diphosphatase
VSDASDRTAPEPPEERLARRLEARPTRRRTALAAVLHDLTEVDRAVYRAIASTRTPTLDAPLRRLSDLANHSKIWLVTGGAIFVVGGRTGRRAASIGLAAVGINSAVVNLPMKFATKRARPEREIAGVPEQRWVPMPASTSFPSGHSASAFAFAGAVAGSMPILSVPLRLLAGAVAYSRVHTGVHYPGDVVVGSLVGATIGEATSLAARAIFRRRDERRRSRSRPSDDRRRTDGGLRSPR